MKSKRVAPDLAMMKPKARPQNAQPHESAQRSRKLRAMPEAKKVAVAAMEGSCRLEMPVMAWPEVQPPEARVPAPMRMPPKKRIRAASSPVAPKNYWLKPGNSGLPLPSPPMA
jgi:hypothetical protein